MESIQLNHQVGDHNSVNNTHPHENKSNPSPDDTYTPAPELNRPFTLNPHTTENIDTLEADSGSDDSDFDSHFEDTYHAMKPEAKWHLPSGKTVEDILHGAYTYDKNEPDTACIRNWILDVSDRNIQDLFTSEDWRAICAEIPPLPTLDDKFLEALQRFDGITTTAQLRKVLASTSCSPDAEEADFDVEWAEGVIRHFLSLYEYSSLALSDCLERWYDYNIWSRVIDDCLRSIPKVLLDRCESSSQSYLLRKNRNRANTSSRVKPGPRFDGLLRNYPGRTQEFCVIESSPALRGGVISTKWLSDKAKVGKALREMINRLDIEANCERRVLDKLQVVGISTAGLTMQVSRMSRQKGYVCLLTVNQPVQIPHSVEQFRELLVFLAGFLRVKLLIANATTLFQSRALSADRERLRQDLSTAFEERNPEMLLPAIADTP